MCRLRLHAFLVVEACGSTFGLRIGPLSVCILYLGGGGLHVLSSLAVTLVFIHNLVRIIYGLALIKLVSVLSQWSLGSGSPTIWVLA